LINTTKGIRYIGKIPIRNLWLLLLYASDLYRDLGNATVDFEESPDEIADLVAEVLCSSVDNRLKRNLSFGFIEEENELSRLRGRVDILTTERRRLLEKGKIHCRYQNLTINTPRNRYVRSALEHLQPLVTKISLRRKCKFLSNSLGRLGVNSEKPIDYNSKRERFGRHESLDRRMVTAADLAFSLYLPTEFTGKNDYSLFEEDIGWLRKLFEKAIAGFYYVALDDIWKVEDGTRYNWQVNESTEGMQKILPSMKTDIILSKGHDAERIIIDTKFNSLITKGWHRDNTIRSGYLYQIYSYIRSQEDKNFPATLNSTGMLLHPTIEDEFNESVTIQGHKIRFCTVNLASTPIEIRQQLLSLIE